MKKHTKNFLDHNIRADCRILVLFGTTVDTTCHQTAIRFHLTQHMLLHYQGKLKYMKSALKWIKTPKTIHDVRNLEKDNKIFL